jgi:nucleoside-diphosphate-sugar epimerase
MKVLIIGGTGNIGSGITKLLLDRGGFDITLFNRGNDDAWNGRTRLIVGDRGDRLRFEESIREAGPWDCVIDMICFGPEDAQSDIRAVGGRTKQFIFTSTVDAYTKDGPFPVPVDGERKPVQSYAYGYNKAQAEFVFDDAAKKGEFELTIIRPVATCSDTWLPLTFVAPVHGYVMRRIRDGKPIIMHGDGTAVWPFTHRDDVAVAYANAIGNSKAFGKSYVTSPDIYHSWMDYYRTAARVMGAPEVRFVHIPSTLLARMVKGCDWIRDNIQYTNIFDNAPAKQDLGFRITLTLEQIMLRCLSNPGPLEQINTAADFPAYDKIIEAWRKHEDEMVRKCQEWGVAPD